MYDNTSSRMLNYLFAVTFFISLCIAHCKPEYCGEHLHFQRLWLQRAELNKTWKKIWKCLQIFYDFM